MKQIRTSQLIGPLLDWAVAQCMKLDVLTSVTEQITFNRRQYPNIVCADTKEQWAVFSPSTLPEQGKQIIERVQIVLIQKSTDEWHGILDTRNDDRRHWEQNRFSNSKSRWRASPPDQFLFVGAAKEPLIAAMRSYVAALHGDEIMVPDYVLQALGLL